MQRRWAVLGLLLAVAWAAGTTYSLVINGKAVAGQAIVVNGQTYVPLSALKAAGVGSTLAAGKLSLTLPGAAPGGANQLTALEGCIGETLYNGVWRFRVTKFESGEVEGKPGWLMGVEMRNAFNKTVSPFVTGFDNSSNGYSWATADGNTGIWKTSYILNDFATKDIPQGGMFTYEFKIFPALDATEDQMKTPPTKFILRIDAKTGQSLSGAKYSVPDPSYRINLTCKK